MKSLKPKCVAFASFISSAFRIRRAYVFTLSPEKHLTCTGNHDTSEVAPIFRFMGRADIEALMPLMQGLAEDVALKRMDAGDLCVCGMVNGMPVHIRWIHIGPCFIRGLGYNHKIQTNHAYSYGTYTLPSFRRRGIYKASLGYAACALFRNGIQQFSAIVMAGNDVVLHTLPSLGWERSKCIFHRRILGVHYTAAAQSRGRTCRHVYIGAPRDIYLI